MCYRCIHAGKHSYTQNKNRNILKTNKEYVVLDREQDCVQMQPSPTITTDILECFVIKNYDKYSKFFSLKIIMTIQILGKSVSSSFFFYFSLSLHSFPFFFF